MMSDPHPSPVPQQEEVGGGDPNTSVTILVFIVSAILVFVAIVALQALFYTVQDQTISQINRGDPRRLTRLRAEQQETLNSYAWKDEQNQVVAIPIERAMDLVVRELASGEAEKTTQTNEPP